MKLNQYRGSANNMLGRHTVSTHLGGLALVALLLGCSSQPQLNAVADSGVVQVGGSGTAPHVPTIISACSAAAGGNPLQHVQLQAAIQELEIASEWSGAGQDASLYWQMAVEVATTAEHDSAARCLLNSVCEAMSRTPQGVDILLAHLRNPTGAAPLKRACLSALADSPGVASVAEFGELARSLDGHLSPALGLAICLDEVGFLEHQLQAAGTELQRAHVLVEMLGRWTPLLALGNPSSALSDSMLAATPLERWVHDRVRLIPTGVFLSVLAEAEQEIYLGVTPEERELERFDFRERIAQRVCDYQGLLIWRTLVGTRPNLYEE